MSTTAPSRTRADRAGTHTARRWSQQVAEHSDALDLQQGVFAQRDPKRIAASLKRSAERSDRRKTTPFRSAMSMLTFYLNRAGKTLSAAQRRRVEAAKAELRRLFGRGDPGTAAVPTGAPHGRTSSRRRAPAPGHRKAAA